MNQDPHAVALGKKGGRAGTGAAKARTHEQSRAAANARWQKRWRKDLGATLDKMLKVAERARRDGDECAADYIEYAERGLRNFCRLPNDRLDHSEK